MRHCIGLLLVALDLTITDELRQEGLARDVVRNIQDARKSMNYGITDRIVISVDGELPAAWVDYICGETLAALGKVENPGTTITVAEGKEAMTIAIAKA